MIKKDKLVKIDIYDCTLRDGAQAAGISFSSNGKIAFAKQLDEFGVSFIEGGYAGSNEKDMQFFYDIKKEKLSRSKIVAFGSTRRADIDVDKDEFVRSLIAADTEYCTIFGKTWNLHVAEVLRTTPANNLQMIADTIGYLKSKDRKVFFDAEHFFDGFKNNSEYALKVLQTAANEGCECIVLCDTNGGCLPNEIFSISQKVISILPKNVSLGIHVHNDSGLAVANSIEAVRAGATQVQGCINGYGERTGNANLTTIIPNLELKMGMSCVADKALHHLRDLSLFVDDLVNQRPDVRAPFVGKVSFSHKAGTHVAGVRRNPKTFEHIDPESVGNKREILLSELSGGANIMYRLKQYENDGEEISKTDVKQILDELKRLESKGYSYESANGSFKILVKKMLHKHKDFFKLDGFRVIIEKRGASEPCFSEATVKLKIGDKVSHTVGEGEGPVDALDKAMRNALADFFPQIKNMILSDFRVRILDPQEAMSATTQVQIESQCGNESWSTVGVSRNIIEASWQALLDSVEYKLFEDEEKNRE